MNIFFRPFFAKRRYTISSNNGDSPKFCTRGLDEGTEALAEELLHLLDDVVQEHVDVEERARGGHLRLEHAVRWELRVPS